MTKEPRFQLGQVVVTRGALEEIDRETMTHALGRHVTGDWGDLCEADKTENELSVEQGCRILSAYLYESAPKFWIITEADRSATTILLPDEY